MPVGNLPDDNRGRLKMKNRYDVIVVGAGAAGMMAAISSARAGARTAILEHMEQAGKKLLSTGNGKCNFTNRVQGVEYYRGQNPAFVLPALKQFGVDRTLEFFQEIGIWAKEKRGGYYYPASEQAASLRQALVLELDRLGVDIHYNVGIRKISKEKNIFYFDTKQGIYQSDVCVIATGGKAAKKTGSDGSGIPYIVGFGHKMIDFVPALVQLQGKQSFLKEIAGIRADSLVRLYVNRTKFSEDRGEVQLTDFGVSGIPAFQISRYAVLALKKQQQVYVTIDFAPDMKETELCTYFIQQKQRNPKGYVKDSLIGLLNTKLIPVLMKEAGIENTCILSHWKQEDMQKLIFVIKNLRIDIIGNKSFDFAQVCAGGVCTDEINPETMESKLVKNLFFAGEIIDIDGMCGGYNLQWAWSSGWLAGYYGGKR